MKREGFDLGDLGDALTWSGLGEYVGCFDPLEPRAGDWEAHIGAAPARLRPLIELFLLNRSVHSARIDDAVRAGLTALAAAGLVEARGEKLSLTDGLSIVPVFGRWVICQAPRADPRFYFGDDTVALLARMTPLAGGRCLDLCAGPGTLAMHAAGSADHVVAVEKAPAVARLARLNTGLNRLSRRIEVVEGDLYEPVAGRRFETILANPPLLPLPDGLGELPLGDGGADGFKITRAILSGLADMLAPRGVGLLIGVGLSDRGTPLGLESLAEAGAGRLDLTVSLLSRRAIGEGTPFLDMVAATVAQASGHPPGRIRRAYLDLLARAGADAFCHLFVQARHGTGLTELIDLSSAHRGEAWRWRR